MAVSLYHQRRGNYRGATKLMKKAIGILQEEEEALVGLSLDYNELLDLLSERLSELEKEQPYRSINLPITSDKLVTICKKKCERLGVAWGTPSNLQNEYIVHKHILRDRSAVRSERIKQKKLREARNH